MEKVYLVTTGTYSDYRVLAAFSTKTKAEEYIKYIEANKYHDYNHEWINKDIEEIELDPDSNIDNLVDIPVWRVQVNKLGDIKHVILERENSPKLYENKIEPIGIWKFLYIQTKDKEHAIKIAGEMRTQLIATDKWD